MKSKAMGKLMTVSKCLDVIFILVRQLICKIQYNNDDFTYQDTVAIKWQVTLSMKWRKDELWCEKMAGENHHLVTKVWNNYKTSLFFYLSFNEFTKFW